MRGFLRIVRAIGLGVLAAPSCSIEDGGFSLGPGGALVDVAPRRISRLTDAVSLDRKPGVTLANIVEVPRPLVRKEPPVEPALPAAPEPIAEPAADDAEDANVLVATAKETLIYARPSSKAPKIGYLRAGDVVRREAHDSGHEGCRGGFYQIVPEGYVCVGNGASIDPHHDLGRAVPRHADRTASLPYVYGFSKTAGAPLYSRLPTAEEQRNAEPDLGARVGHWDARSFDGVPRDDVPWFLADGASSIGTNGYRFSRRGAVLGTAIARSAFAFVSVFDSGGRSFGLTADMAVVPLDRFTRIEPSKFHGLPLTDSLTLPVAFIRGKSAALYSGDPTSAGLHFERRLEFREAVPVTGKRVQVGRVVYLETQTSQWIVDPNLLLVEAVSPLPPWATPGRTWIDVSIDRQALVAYVGARPAFVTLVSTGADGTGDPETTRSTVQGQFLIHTKHVTVTMDGDEVGDEFDLRDVPYVQYFKEGFALHAAYWHDGFGTPRSHGCVNLSPLDARWIFAWTEPSVPAAWHGAMSLRGTLVSIHP